MEAVGVLASAAQISGYVFKIISAVQDARTQIRNGPTRLQDRSKQLLFLNSIIDVIKGNELLHTEIVFKYLIRIKAKIKNLDYILTRTLNNIKEGSYCKIWLVFTVIKTDKQILESFTALEQDRDNLHFYLTSIHGVALLNGGEPIFREGKRKEMSVTIYDPDKMQRATEPEIQGGSSTKLRLSQSFGNMSAHGTGSSNRLGNHNAKTVLGMSIDQKFQGADAKEGGKNEAGNTDSNKEKANYNIL